MERDIPTPVTPQAQSLSLYIQNAVEQLKQGASSNQGKSNLDIGGLIFLGNWQDSFPRLLVTDPVLEPVDKIVWQIIRIHINAPGAVTTFPSYESVSKYANIKSNHTIARALAILRATRWLSLCARVRGETGRFLGNIYVLHDEPVTLGDAMYLDTEYMAFLRDCTEHNHPRVRKISESVLATIQDLIDSDRDAMGERIQTRSYERRVSSSHNAQTSPSLILTERTDFFAISDSQIKQLGEEAQEMSHADIGEKDHVQILHTAKSSESHQVQKTHMDKNEQPNLVQNLHMDETKQKMHTDLQRSSNNINTTTTCSSTAKPEKNDDLHFPPGISANERNLALMYLSAINSNQKQDILDEWHGRLQSANNRNTPIDNPIGYLASLCRRAKTGEFNITIGLRIRDKREQAIKRANEEKHREVLERQRQQEIVNSVDEKPVSEMTPIEKRMREIRNQSRRNNSGSDQ